MRAPGVLRAAALTLMWAALWGDAAAGTLLAGLGLAVALPWLFRERPRPALRRLRPLAVVPLAAAFAVGLVRETAVVAAAALRPGARHTVGEVIEVVLPTRSATVATLVANAATLTPGTLALALDAPGTRPAVLTLHVLNPRATGRVSAELRRLVALAERALPARQGLS